MKKFKDQSKFKKSLLIYLIVLILLGIAFITYVSICLYRYEKNTNPEEKFIAELRTAAKKGKISDYFKLNKVDNKYEAKPSLTNGYKELLNSKNVYAKSKKNDVYDIYSDDTLVCTVTFNKGDKKTVLGLLTYNEYSVKDVVGYNEFGLYTIDIYANSGDQVYINDNAIYTEDLVETNPVKGYEEVSTLANVPKINHYRVTNLTHKPTVTVNGPENEKRVVNIKDNTYTVEDTKINTLEEAKAKFKADINPLEFARNYTLFMANDLAGGYRGFNTLKPNLIKDTELYTSLFKWGSGIDITFMSGHTFDTEKFTNESLSNFVFYNDESFSVEVNTQLNFILDNVAREHKNIPHHAIYYYIIENGSYKLVSWDQLG